MVIATVEEHEIGGIPLAVTLTGGNRMGELLSALSEDRTPSVVNASRVLDPRGVGGRRVEVSAAHACCCCYSRRYPAESRGVPPCEATPMTYGRRVTDPPRRRVADRIQRAAAASSEPDAMSAAAACRRRYETTGDARALEAALRLGRKALRERLGTGPGHGSAALELAVSLAGAYGRTGVVAILDEALEHLREAARVLPATHEDLPAVHMNIGAARLQRYIHCGDVEDLHASVTAMLRSVELTPAGNHAIAGRHANLAGALRTRYQALGDVRDLEESIARARVASRLTAVDSPHLVMMWATLASSLIERFGHFARDEDLDEAADAAGHALANTGAGHVHRATTELLLASVLRCRFERHGSIGDLNEAVRLQRSATGRLPETSPEYALQLYNLASGLRLRFDRFDMPDDIEAATAVSGEALRRASAHARGRCLSLRGHCLHKRSALRAAAGDMAGAERDAGEAIEACEQAVRAEGSDSSERVRALIALGSAYGGRHDLTSRQEDAARALDAFRTALASVGPDDPQRSVCLVNIARLQTARDDRAAYYRSARAAAGRGEVTWALAALGLMDVLGQDLDAAKLSEVRSVQDELAATPSAPARLRLVGAWRAAALMTAQGDLAAGAAGYVGAIELLPAAVWQGGDRPSREARLVELAGLASDAAATQLATGDPLRALECLEQGRNVLWSEMLRLRSHDALLWDTHPGIAARLRDIAAALDAG